ncbi:MAG: YihA family ribosome biogenesis GTP-binding protein [Magnetococcales bacterium]|nr:YihA family ribosome biogenesis GTP-binding protein [Magnetococcales bacterium]
MTAPTCFLLGVQHASQLPPEDLPEIAFAGRSNAGKSSLINAFLQRKALVRVSRTPGCTRQINFFQVGERWLVVDLPGYGFAKVAESERRHWQHLMEEYFRKRRALRAVVVVLDLRRGITDLDRGLAGYLDDCGVATIPVATKIDQVKGNARRSAIAALTRECQTTFRLAAVPLVATSSLNGEGIEVLRQQVDRVLGFGAESQMP